MIIITRRLVSASSPKKKVKMQDVDAQSYDAVTPVAAPAKERRRSGSAASSSPSRLCATSPKNAAGSLLSTKGGRSNAPRSPKHQMNLSSSSTTTSAAKRYEVKDHYPEFSPASTGVPTPSDGAPSLGASHPNLVQPSVIQLPRALTEEKAPRPFVDKKLQEELLEQQYSPSLLSEEEDFGSFTEDEESSCSIGIRSSLSPTPRVSYHIADQVTFDGWRDEDSDEEIREQLSARKPDDVVLARNPGSVIRNRNGVSSLDNYFDDARKEERGPLSNLLPDYLLFGCCTTNCGNQHSPQRSSPERINSALPQNTPLRRRSVGGNSARSEEL
ncbi:unnamed protein product [Amoebophrya sp. A120]|nr:unnamed protein product [Amoebophrya sp. A120]|eukprot:GSA120T00007848001.1